MKNKKKNNSKYFRYLLCLIVLSVVYFLSPIAAIAQTPLSLEDAIRIGLEQNHAIKISILKAKSVGEAHVDEMIANRLPSLKLFGSYTRLSDIAQTPIVIPIPGVPPFAFKTYLPDNYSFRLSLQQPIFTGFRLQNLQIAAEHNSAAAQADVKSGQRGILFHIKLQYWTLYKLQRTLEAVSKNIDESNAHLADIRSRLSNGTVLANDTLKMQVQLSNNQLRKFQTEKDIRIAMASLMNTLALPLDANVTLVTAPEADAHPQRSLDSLLKMAIAYRSELTAADERIQASKANVIAARSALFPQVSIGGNLYYSDPNQRYFPVLDAFKMTWDASINLSWDLWTWNIAGLQAQQAEFITQQLQETKKQTEEEIALEVTQNYLTEQTSFAQIQVAKLSVTQARENLRIVKMQYTKGVANTTDMIDAETAALQADVNVATAVADANIATAQLARSLGE